MKVLITGGTSGIGKKTVELLSSNGHEVIFSGRDEKRAKHLEQATGAQFILCDISTVEGCAHLTQQYFDLHESCDVLINNAGLWSEGTIDNTSVREIEKVFAINTIAPIILSKYFIAKMKDSIDSGIQDHSKLIFVNSIAGLTSKAQREVYSSSKWAITGFTRGLSDELSEHKISVTNLCPGAVDTELFEHGGYPRDTSSMMDPIAVANAIKYIVDQPRDVKIKELAIQPSNYI